MSADMGYNLGEPKSMNHGHQMQKIEINLKGMNTYGQGQKWLCNISIVVLMNMKSKWV